MRTRTKPSQKIPTEYKNRIPQFHGFFNNAGKQGHLELSQLGKMDAVPLIFDMPSNKAVEIKSAKIVFIKKFGHERCHDSLVLS